MTKHASTVEIEQLRAELARVTAERDRLTAGGCARDQRMTQHCAIAADMQRERDAAVADNAALRKAIADYQEAEEANITGADSPGPLLDRMIWANEQLRAALAQPHPGAKLLERLAAMEKVLREVEWFNDGSCEYCLACDSYKTEGHASNCRLASTLKDPQP